MFGPQLNALRFAAKSFARRAKWGTAAVILVLIGLGFLLSAGWILLSDRYGAVPTALVCGVVFIILGLLAYAFSRYPPRAVPKEVAREMQNPLNSPALSTAGLVNALILGIFAGRAARRRR